MRGIQLFKNSILPWKEFHQHHLSRFHMYALIYYVFFSLSVKFSQAYFILCYEHDVISSLKKLVHSYSILSLSVIMLVLVCQGCYHKEPRGLNNGNVFFNSLYKKCIVFHKMRVHPNDLI